MWSFNKIKAEFSELKKLFSSESENSHQIPHSGNTPENNFLNSEKSPTILPQAPQPKNPIRQPPITTRELRNRQNSQNEHLVHPVKESTHNPSLNTIKPNLQSTSSTEDHFAEVSYRSLGSRFIFTYPKPQPLNPNSNEQASKNKSWIRWVPLGEPSTVNGITIPGGGIYIGSSPRHAYDTQQVDPSFIDVRLPVAHHPKDVDGAGLSYWPSYRHIPEISRRTYLEWLATGKKDTSYQIGYVFLYFYGLERRLLHDAKVSKIPKGELSLLREEVRRLLDIFGGNSSFRGYALRLLDFLEVTLSTKKLYDLGPKISDEAKDSIFNQTAIAQLVQDDKPIPAEWALAWAQFGSTCQFRTPANRSGGHFRRLFLLRFNQKFPKGLRFKKNKTKLQSYFRPANQTLEIGNHSFSDLPNPMVLKRPSVLLQDMVDTCTSLLEPYSRWLGRNEGQELSLRAFALLPKDLLLVCGHPLVNAWRNRLQVWLGETEEVFLSGKSWLEDWPFPDPTNIGKKDSVEFIAFLAKLGAGIEPDPRFGGKPLSNVDKVLLFKIEEDFETSGPDFRFAKLEVHLATLVAWADGAIVAEESQLLFSIIEHQYNLTAPEKRRLRCYCKWLLEEKPSLSGIKTHLAKFDTHTRQALGQHLVATAIADGRVDPKEIRILEKLYSLLDLDASAVISQIHSARSNNKVFSKADTPKAPPPRGIPGFLDPELIHLRKRESEKVAQLLGGIFDLEDGMDEETAIPDSVAEGQEDGLFGLDPAHTKLLLWLGEAPYRPRTEVENFCSKLGLFPDGALETLNEMAFERQDEPLLEDGETVEIILETYERLFA